jgi:hypothetical protein
MTPQQALQLLTQVTANVPMSRDAHSQVLAALEVLRKELEAPKPLTK